MLKLKHLRFSGIGRFVDTQEVSIEHLGNLIQVDGENRNTGGSSGAAKTTVFNALDYLFGLNDIPVTVLQSRLTKEPIHVVGYFDFDGKPLTIARSKKGLSIELGDELTGGSNKLTEEKLDEIIGMSRDVFRKILHKRQKEGGFFLKLTPKKMYEFLTDVLKMEKELANLTKVDLKLSQLEKLKTAGHTSILSIQSALKATQEGVLSLGLPPIRDIHQQVVLDLKGKYDVSTKRFKEIEENHRSETRELEETRPKVHVSSFDTSESQALTRRSQALTSDNNRLVLEERERIVRVQANIASKNLEKSMLDFAISQGVLCKETAADLAGQIKKIRDAICPTCEQGWLTETAKAKENELLAKIAECKEKIADSIKAVELAKTIGSDLLHWHGQLSPIINPQIAINQQELVEVNKKIVEERQKAELHNATQNAANSSILQQFATKQSELRSRHFKEIDQHRGQMEVDRRAFEAAVSKLKAYEDARIRYENALSSMKHKEKETELRLDQEVESVLKIEKEMEKAEELRKAIKLYISCSFDEALEIIGNAATRIIRCIPTMSNATIQFESQKETKEGKVNEEVNAVISMDGDIGIPLKSLSGGEGSAVDLAVDLSVIDFVESESGKGIDVFILDEPFTGLDTIGIEMALEVLKNSNSSKKLIVVDHNPEVKQLVSNRLVVVREGSTSNIVSQEVSNG